MDEAGFQRWLDDYVAAWQTYDKEAIGNLFTDDAEYRYHPWDEPISGRDAIVASWLETPDAAGSWSAEYRPWAIDEDRAVAVGVSRYLDAATTSASTTTCSCAGSTRTAAAASSPSCT